MASYPGSKIHRVNRRKLGRGQHPALPSTAVTVTAQSADVARIVSATPVVWSSPVPLSVAVVTYVSQHVVDQFTVDVTFSGALSGHAWTLGGTAGTNYAGGATAAASGTF